LTATSTSRARSSPKAWVPFGAGLNGKPIAGRSR
jgi:hypothetical protein